MLNRVPWAVFEKRLSPEEARASVLSKLLSDEPNLLGGTWVVYRVPGREPRRIYADPRRQILVLVDESGHPRTGSLKKRDARLADLRVTFDPPLGRVRGMWQIWCSDEVYF